MPALNTIFSPGALALIGASEKPGSVGRLVLTNLIEGHFQGKLYLVNPNHHEILGQPARPSIGSIEGRVDMAVITTPPKTVLRLIDECGEKGVKLVVIISAGFDQSLMQQIVDRARSYGIRILGPNCLGFMRPSIGLNATFSKAAAKPGSLALVSQSGALCTAILDWAQAADVGFSSVISLGDAADMDFGEILDYLLADPATSSILIYIEGIRTSRRFMSALRVAARIKPVLVLKVGRHPTGSLAAMTHTGSLVGSDEVFDAALRRAGTVRIKTYSQLFAAAKLLSASHGTTGSRLCIITNGGGPGVMAADSAAECKIELAKLSENTVAALNEFLPPSWSHSNPIDLIGDATTERYKRALAACVDDPEIDSILVMLTPQAMTEAEEIAHAVVQIAKHTPKLILTCWMGEASVESSRHLFDQEKIPSFASPEDAVESFSYLASYHQNQQLLLQVPGPLSEQEPPDVEGAKILIETALSEKRRILSEIEAKALLGCFHVPITPTFAARSPAEALVLAEQIGFPLAMKINSLDISHKSDVGGVKLSITDAKGVATAYRDILERVKKARPDARIDGVSLQPMLAKPNRREVMVGVTTDPVFGPVIRFGIGGTAVEALGEGAIALPPLNRYLIDDLISRSRSEKLLGEFRSMPPIHREALANVLLRVSEMVCELPYLKEMDINPLMVDENGAVAADARVVIGYPERTTDYSHVAIYPYPTRLEKEWLLADGTLIDIRPIRPEDAAMVQAFVRGLSEEARYLRFFSTITELSPQMLSSLTQIDYDREMALVAITVIDGVETEIGVARYHLDSDGESCEFAIVIADEWQSRGLGTKLMLYLMESAKDKGVKRIEGDVLAENAGMLNLVGALGFSIKPTTDPTLKRVVKALLV